MIYVRVKHQKQTIFARVKPNETIFRLKLLLCTMLKRPKDTKQIRLLQLVKQSHVPLENNATLDSLGIVNDCAIYMVMMQDGKFWLTRWKL
jgi:hypothetical protein